VTSPGGDPTSFTFNTLGLGGGGLGFSATSALTDAATPADLNVAPGTYSVTEAAQAGWIQTPGTCDDGSNPSSIGISAGETVTCTFSNTQAAIFGKTMGFWGNKNGHAVLDPGEDGTIDVPVVLGGPARDVTVSTIAINDQILPDDPNACGDPNVFTSTGDCTLSPDLNFNTLNVLVAQTLALSYNILELGGVTTGFAGQTLASLACTGFATAGLSGISTVEDARDVANALINLSGSDPGTTQSAAGAMNALLGCLNRETL